MPTIATDTQTITVVEEKSLIAIETKLDEEAQVILHCRVKSVDASLIRIWKSSFLFDGHSDHRSHLILNENIALYPEWTVIGQSPYHHFTLIFSALPKYCTLFHFIEEIPEPGGFVFRNIQRNKSDVYYLELGS